MNNLPNELIQEIIQYVPVQETFKKLRCVSKKWKIIVDHLKPQTLTILGVDQYIKRKLLMRLDSIMIKDEEFFLSVLCKSTQFNKLKKLSAIMSGEYLIDPSRFYNRFTEIEELTIDNYKPMNEIGLRLKKLKKLKFKDHLINQIALIDTPQLEYLILDNLYLITFNDNLPNLKILQIKYTDSFDQMSKLNKLISLERLIFKNHHFQSITNQLLRDLINLKELHFYEMDRHSYRVYRNELTFRRNNLRIILKGFTIDQFNLIDDYEDLENYRYDLEKFTLQYLMENYEKFTGLKSEFSANYCELAEIVKELPEKKLPDDFFTKVRKITNVNVFNEVKDMNFFLDFIEKTETKSLQIKNKCPRLNSLFFYQLTQRCQFIRNFYVGTNQNLNLVLELSTKMVNLKSLSLNQRTSIDFLIKAIKKAKCNSLDGFFTLNNGMGSINYYCSLNYLDGNFGDKNYGCYMSLNINTMDTYSHDFEDPISDSDEIEFHIFKLVKFQDHKSRLVSFLERINYEFQLIEGEKDSKNFIYLVENFINERKTNDRMMRELCKNKQIYISKEIWQ